MNRTPTQTACTDAHSVSQHVLHRLTIFHHANTRGSRAGRLRIAQLCVPKQMSSTCHVSFLAALDTDHKHKFSLTYFTYLSDNLTNTHKIFCARSIFTLRSSTAEWRINTNPISHKNSSQQPDSNTATRQQSDNKTEARQENSGETTARQQNSSETAARQHPDSKEAARQENNSETAATQQPDRKTAARQQPDKKTAARQQPDKKTAARQQSEPQ